MKTTKKFIDERVWFSVKFNLGYKTFRTEIKIFEYQRIEDYLPKDSRILNIVPIITKSK